MKYIEYEQFVPLQIDSFYNSYRAEIKEIHNKLHSGTNSMTDWVDFPKEVLKTDLIERIRETAAKINAESTAMVVVGIGGSNLGTQALHQMLKHRCTKTRLLYAGCNLSGQYHNELLKRLDAEKDVSVCVVSKSGGTFEVMLAFGVLKKYMQARYGDDYCKRIYVITDPVKGELRKEAIENGYTAFEVPPEIGGRYSVHTAVGMLPMAVAGLDIEEFINGASMAVGELGSENIEENPCYQYALLSFLCNKEFKKSLEMFSVTEKKFTLFTKWLVQLFGESEGKDGRGIFPTTALYSTDFHSLGQFLATGNQIYFESNFYLVNSTVSVDNEYIAEVYKNLNNYVHETVVRVRKNSNVPLFSFGLKDLNEAMVGYLFYYFEKACAVRSYLHKVNPFNQPDVELYKKEMRELCI